MMLQFALDEYAVVQLRKEGKDFFGEITASRSAIHVISKEEFINCVFAFLLAVFRNLN